MRLSRLCTAAPVLALVLVVAPPAARADDTEAFLKPDNWEGNPDIWTLDAKTKTVVGEVKKDPGYNTFFCSNSRLLSSTRTFICATVVCSSAVRNEVATASASTFAKPVRKIISC